MIQRPVRNSNNKTNSTRTYRITEGEIEQNLTVVTLLNIFKGSVMRPI